MFRDETCLDRFAAMLLGVSIAGAATAGFVLWPGGAEALGGLTGLVLRLRGQNRTEADKVLANLQRELKANWRAWGAHSSHADEGLRESVVASFEEVIPSCAPSAAEVVGKRLDASAIASLVLDKAVKARRDVYADRFPNDTDAHLARTFLFNLTREAYGCLLAEKDYIDKIAPQLWEEILAQLDRIERGQEEGFRKSEERDRETQALGKEALALLQRLNATVEAQAAHRAGVSDERILKLAQRIAADVPDLDRAFAELERAVEVAIEVQTRGALGSNTGHFVDEVLARMAALSAESRDAEAAAEADRAFAEWEDHQRLETQKGIALLEAGLRADILRRDAASAARRIARRIELESPDATDRFAGLRAEQDVWYVRGRDAGLNFDLEVSIDLARIAHARARDADERGSALNDLAVSLQTLGGRESGTERLEQAVAAYRAALEERTRDRVPLDWATTQMNLGSALLALGERESGTDRLEQAVAAYRAALEERTRERVPLGWATTQMNLGNALRALGEREGGTERLEQAVAAYRAALEERTRERVPLGWATSKGNLAIALATLADRSGRDRAPALAEIDAALEVFRAAGAEAYLDWAEGVRSAIVAAAGR